MTRAWIFSTAIVLALGGSAAAQPVSNPYFPPQAPSIPAPPPSGNYMPYFGRVAPSAYSAPAIPSPLPSVLPVEGGNPFLPVDYASHRTRSLSSLCEPGNLGGSFQPCNPSGDAGNIGDTPGIGSPDHPANKHPRLYKYRFGPDPNEPRFWASAEYLLWHISGDRVVSPVAASANTTDITQIIADPRGQATAINNIQTFGMASGGRISLGYWKEEYCCVSWGLEGNAFILERRADSLNLASDAGGSPPILRPFIDPRTGQPSLAIVSFPGTAAGSLTVSSGPYIWGGELNVVRRINEKDAIHWDLIAGLRYLDLDENLSIVQNSTLLANGLAGFGGQTIRAPNGLTIVDAYNTRTQFFGGQFGTRLGCRYHRLVVDAYTKVALGWSHEVANSSGSTTLTGPGGGQTLAGGFLKVPANSGRLVGDDFAVVPEVGLQIGYDVTSWLRITGGYSALYWSQVARPGTQVQWYVNPTQVPSSLEFGQPSGDPLPATSLARTGLWLNGVNFGATIKY